ncbi:MAG TPA: hypothetical protein VFO86_09425, partial [Terriglobia bacterium]|nr:hypothetical protein [Terriglobia bacterium]
VISVAAQLEPKPTKLRTESTATISLRLTKNVLASIYCSYNTALRRSYIEVLGTKGNLAATDFTLSNKTIPLTITIGAPGFDGEMRTESINVPNLYEKEVTLFSSAVLENKRPPIPGEVGLENQYVLNTALHGGGLIKPRRSS